MKSKISKEKLVMSITIGIACFALMLVMFMQFKVVEQTDITAIETMRESELRLELSSWNEKYNQLNTRYQEVIAKIEEYKTERVSDEKTAQLLQTELAQLNQVLGKTEVTVDLKDIPARIEPGAIIREQVEIGQNAVIMMGAIINIGAVIGDGTMIDMGAVLGGRAIVGKNCHIGAGTVLAGVVEPASATPVIVEDNVMIGANAVVIEGCRIGHDAVVAAGAVVVGDVAPNTVVAGCPARVIKVKDEKTAGKTALVDALREL